jgi:hypothetical protein
LYRTLFAAALTAAFLALRAHGAMAQDSTRAAWDTGYFYRGLPYGSESQFGPLNVVVNEGFDILQVDSRHRRVFDYDYGRNARRVFRTLGDPLGVVGRYGWSRFLRYEVLPLSSYRGGGAQWVPNYQLHLLGSGMASARLTEWYRARGVRHAGLASGATLMGAHLLNEIVENNDSEAEDAAAISDLYLFDLGGILLFRSERVQRFAARQLGLTTWGEQPMVDPRTGTLENAGQWFASRIRVPGTDRWSVFQLWGMGGLFGLSRSLDDGWGASGALGFATSDVTVVDSISNRQTVELRTKAGVFIDRHNSLMASVWYRTSGPEALTVNLYPGVIGRGRLSPGVWLSLGRPGALRVGVAASWSQGLGFAASTR